MKSSIKLAATGTLVSLSFAALSMAPVFADSPADIASGSIYEIKNLTQNVNYANPASANAGDELEYSVRLHNTNYTAATNINVAATLPTGASTSNTSDATITYAGGVTSTQTATGSATLNLTSSESLSYVNGTSELLDVNGNVIKALPDGVTGTGVNVGSLNGSTVEYVNFEVKVGSPTPPTPEYACTELGLTAENNRTVNISSFTTTATNATFSNASINWGDNSSATTSSSPVGQTHQYSANGTYTVVATANFNVNGQTESATSASCKQTVTFSSTTPPTVTPPTTTTPTTPAATPTSLVNTGAGNVFGIFAAVSLASTVAYRLIVKKNLSRI